MTDTLDDRSDAQAIPHLVAADITRSAGGKTPSTIDLASAISEIQTRSQISGASTLTVDLIDPDWVILTSGFLDLDENGRLDTIEVNYPDGSDSWWRLVGVDASLDLSGPNVTLTFEDRVVAYLRDHWGPKTVPPGTTTRAQFLKSNVDEVGRTGGVPKLRFVCPSLPDVQPLAADTTTAVASSSATPAQLTALSGTTIVQTPAQQKAAAAKASKSRGVHPKAAITVKGQPANAVQIANINALLGTAELLKAGPLATVALICAGIGESDMGAAPDTFTAKYQGVLQGDPANIDVHDPTALAAAFLKGGKGFQAGGAMALSRTVSDPGEIATKVEASGEPGSFYGQWAPEARAIIAAYGGIALGSQADALSGASAAPVSDVSQLTRGTLDNPDEDSWDCGSRLAQEVDWFWFADTLSVYFMSGPDLIGQTPALYLDRVEDRAMISRLDTSVDNTSFTHVQPTTGKKKTPSRVAKADAPSEVHLDLVCAPDQYRAGEVFVLRGCGPADGRWIVQDATRNNLADIHTTFTLVLPPEPLPEPRAQDTATGAVAMPTTNTVTKGKLAGVAQAAEIALQQKDKYVYTEDVNARGNRGTLFGPAPRTMDCSAFATLCYKAAGLPDPNHQDYSPIGATGSLIAHCTKIGAPVPGDLCFFGDSEAHTTHVTVYVGNGQAISMGMQGDPEKGPATTTGPKGFLGYYRSDVAP
ncbi:C40 family peptidase [Paraconexibacter antarcticus]|uniref:C40 family peptidase n=1 Tax=Paraconexibacter antarcticus TaxID=2949664 RepID=A0ABY5DNP9_9ACTN|nr:NlpC/P60 family protein [Paraconexibacter antarcticus]UTI62244.1 C40 family peptidase [Paraconexibacter antarcticus]